MDANEFYSELGFADKIGKKAVRFFERLFCFGKLAAGESLLSESDIFAWIKTFAKAHILFNKILPAFTT